MIALLVALLATGAPARAQAVVEGGRPALRIVADDLQDASVLRVGGQIQVCLAGVEQVEVAPAAAGGPALAAGRAECGFQFTVDAEEDLPYEVRRQPGELLLLLGEEPLLLPTAAESTDMQAQMAQLWPGRALPETPDIDSAAVEEDEQLVLRLGPLELRPLLSLTVGAQAGTLEDVPSPDRYGTLILEPGLRATTNLLDGRLQLQYVPTFRRFRNTTFENGVSHHADGRLGLELLPLVKLDAYGNYAFGEMETREVDPGYEYFFGLRPFKRLGAGAVLGYDRGGMADVDLSLDWTRTDLDPGSQYFDNDQWSARAAVRRDIGGDRALAVFYRLGWTNRAPDRPVAVNDVRELGLEWSGELRPEWPLTLNVARQTRLHENAPGESENFSGVVAQGSLSHPFSWLTVALRGYRSTYLSAFEDNGYYVSQGGRLEFSGGLPLRLRFVLTGSLQRNDYPLAAAALGVPRRDDVRSFAIGLSRNVGDSLFIRLDYQFEQRLSNIPGYSNRTGGFTFGVGFTRRKELL